MPPTTRHPHIEGRCGKYLAFTLAQVDKHLRDLRIQLQQARTDVRRRNLAHDADLLLERRMELVLKEPA